MSWIVMRVLNIDKYCPEGGPPGKFLENGFIIVPVSVATEAFYR